MSDSWCICACLWVRKAFLVCEGRKKDVVETRAKEKRGKESESKRRGIGWRWMLVSGDVGGPLILASSCLVIVYFFWPKIDCSGGRWICPWTCFSLFHIFFFLRQGDNTLTNDASLVFSTLIYFRLQSSSIASCSKCVWKKKKMEIMSLDATARGQGNGQWPSWTERHTHTNPQDQIATYIVLFLQFCSTISSNRTICLIGSSRDSPLQRTLDVRFTNYKSAFIYSNTHRYKGDRSMRLRRWGLCVWDWTYT